MSTQIGIHMFTFEIYPTLVFSMQLNSLMNLCWSLVEAYKKVGEWEWEKNMMQIEKNLSTG